MWNREIRICSGPRSHKNKETTDWRREERGAGLAYDGEGGNGEGNQIKGAEHGRGKEECKVKRGEQREKMQRGEHGRMKRACSALPSWSPECNAGLTAGEGEEGEKEGRVQEKGRSRGRKEGAEGMDATFQIDRADPLEPPHKNSP